MVIIDKLSVEINKEHILTDISCELKRGHITSFIGPSGAGKTTLLKAIVGLVKPSTGAIKIDRAHSIGYVFQQFNLFPHRTVLQNCVDPMVVYGLSKEEAKKRAYRLLKQLGIVLHVDKYPSEISGGQQQRTAIARALCLEPQVLILDEPTASLDPDNTQGLVEILNSLKKDNLTIALSTQDTQFINLIKDRIYYLESGKIQEYCDNSIACEQSTYIKHYL